MKVFTVVLGGAGTTSWTPDQDYLLQHAQASTGNCLITEKPDGSITLNLAPGWQNIAWLSSGTASATYPPHFPWKIPLLKGRTIYFVFQASATILLYLDDIIAN